MRKSNAIEILEKQKQIFVDKSYQNTSAWLKLTSSYILEFLGQDSVEYLSFSKFEFTTRFVNMPDKLIELTQKGERSEIIGLLQNSIEKLKTGKLYKKQPKNLFSKLSNIKILIIIAPILGAIFGIGYYFGVEKVNKDAINLETKYRNLKDSVSSIKPFVDNNSVTDGKK